MRARENGPMRNLRRLLLLGCFAAACCSAPAQSQPALGNLFDIPADITVPPVLSVQPAAGKRVRTTTRGWEQTSVYHALYLPDDWDNGKPYPVMVEFPGNGGYQRGDDTSHGTVDGCSLGYGLTKGRG